MAIHFDFLPVSGDSILVTTEDCTMLIDGGTAYPFDDFSDVIPPDKIDIVIITHIDRDHVGGIIELFSNSSYLNEMQQVWFNSPKTAFLFEARSMTNNTSLNDGINLQTLLESYSAKLVTDIHIESTNAVDKVLKEITPTIKVDLLSPQHSDLSRLYKEWDKKKYDNENKKKDETESRTTETVFNESEPNFPLLAKGNKCDSSLPNKSSIAFILNYKELKFLFLGDAHISVICKSLKKLGCCKDDPLEIEFIKLSHHGSKYNINDTFLTLVKSNNYIICRNSHSSLPNIETIAKISTQNNRDINSSINFYITNNLDGDLSRISEGIRKKYNINIIEIDDKSNFTYGEA